MKCRLHRNASVDLYDHLAKLRDLLVEYRHAIDVYSLGMLLLEIGLCN